MIQMLALGFVVGFAVGCIAGFLVRAIIESGEADYWRESTFYWMDEALEMTKEE